MSGRHEKGVNVQVLIRCRGTEPVKPNLKLKSKPNKPVATCRRRPHSQNRMCLGIKLEGFTYGSIFKRDDGGSEREDRRVDLRYRFPTHIIYSSRSF
uniref:Uncharacterized protein n=1 Tax=Lactuca sativa TaxID=4236 RepID=A0A9R1V769_LACSA|nr:hypothetical protein LSAT_V11C600314640 [Lactuca sativa]